MSIKTIMAGAIATVGFTAAAFMFPAVAHAQDSDNGAAMPAQNVTVQPGDILVRIAASYQTTYVRLFDANPQIAHPDVIRPGDVIRIPAADEVLESRPLPGSAPAARAAAAPARQQPQARAASADVPGGVWDRLAQCESSGNWSINTGNGYYGGLQFNLATWQSNGGTGYPHQASKAEQIAVAERLAAARGFSPWPQCAAKLGLL